MQPRDAALLENPVEARGEDRFDLRRRLSIMKDPAFCMADTEPDVGRHPEPRDLVTGEPWGRAVGWGCGPGLWGGARKDLQNVGARRAAAFPGQDPGQDEAIIVEDVLEDEGKLWLNAGDRGGIGAGLRQPAVEGERPGQSSSLRRSPHEPCGNSPGRLPGPVPSGVTGIAPGQSAPG